MDFTAKEVNSAYDRAARIRAPGTSLTECSDAITSCTTGAWVERITSSSRRWPAITVSTCAFRWECKEVA